MVKLKIDRKILSSPLILSVGSGLDSLAGSLIFLDNLTRYKKRSRIIVLYNDFEVFFPFVRKTGLHVAETVEWFAKKMGFETQKIITEGKGFLDKIVFEGEKFPHLNTRWCLFFYRYKPTVEIVNETGGTLCLFWRHDESHVRRSRVKIENNWTSLTVYKGRVYLPIYGLTRKDVLQAVNDYQDCDFLPVLNLYSKYGKLPLGSINVKCWACTARRTDVFEKLLESDRKLYPYVHANEEIKELAGRIGNNRPDEKQRLELAYVLFRHGIWDQDRLKKVFEEVFPGNRSDATEPHAKRTGKDK